MARYIVKHGVRIYEYVVMPSHIHLIVQTTEAGGGLSEFIRDLKRSIAYACKGKWNGASGLWVDRFDDLLLTDEETLRSKVEYIRNNPVKAGLADRPEAYPYSSAWARNNLKSAICGVDEWASLWCKGCVPDTQARNG